MAMKQVALLTICCMGIALCASGQPNNSYELYSWRELNGRWDFCLVASPSGVNVSAEQVFDKKLRLRGVPELKRKLSRLPVGATIFWLDRILGRSQRAGEDGRVGYPPSVMINDIRHYAETHKIKVEMLSGESGQR